MSFVGAASAVDLVIDGSYESSTNNLTGIVGTGGMDNPAVDGGWTSFATYTYSANYTQTGPTGCGQVYLRPYDPLGTVSQTNSLTRAITAVQIDNSQGQYSVSAAFCTYYDQNDNSDLTLQFYNAAMAPVGSPVTLGGLAFVTALPAEAQICVRGDRTLEVVLFRLDLDSLPSRPWPSSMVNRLLGWLC